LDDERLDDGSDQEKHVSSTNRWKYMTASVSWSWTQSSLEQKVQSELDKHSVQGWELSHVTQTAHSGILLIFRRPA
jgi:hypothetical protein